MPDSFDPLTMAWVLDPRGLDRLRGSIAVASEVVLDLETTGLDEHADGRSTRNGGVQARVVLASLTLPSPHDPDPAKPTTWVVPLSHPDSPWLGQWREILRIICRDIIDTARPLTNQNVKFDCRWVHATTGADLSPYITWDTQVGSHLLDETISTSLKQRAPHVFGVTRWDDFDLTYPGAAEDVPLFDLGAYAARDTYWTRRLAEFQRAAMFLSDEEQPEDSEDFENARLGRLAVWCSMPTVATLTGIEQRGIRIDIPAVVRELADHKQAAATLSTTLSARYIADRPDQSWAPTSHWFKEWAAKAVDAGDLRIAELTPTGQPRWSKGVLLRQARLGGQTAAMLLDLRSHAKKAEFLTSWLTQATRAANIHASYNVGSVNTGRLSSSNPNMQQVTASLRPALVPREGFVFADLDYSQIEMRVAAHISGCVPMIEAFQRGDDLHRLLAAKITGKDPLDVTPEERQAAKAGNFGLLFGMGSFGFREYAEDAYGVVFSREEAQVVYSAFFELWDGLAAWHTRAGARVQTDGQVVSPLGRVRRFPDAWRDDSGAPQRAAINAPVQGMASDLMQMAAASISGRLPWSAEPVEGAQIVGTVHDSILVEVAADDWKNVTLACMDRMLDLDAALARMDVRLAVPLAVEAKIGTRWGLSDLGILQ